MKRQNNKVENTENQVVTQKKSGIQIFKTVINVIINILIVVVLVTSVLIAALSLSTRNSPNGLPNLFGYTFQYVQTNSMAAEPPEGFEGGNFSDQDVIISRIYSTEEFPDIKVGDIITYQSDMSDDEGNVIMVTHRIVEEKEIDGEKVFKTKGDNGTEIDQLEQDEYLLPSSIVSVFYNEKYHGVILKGFAEFFRTLRSQKGFFIFIMIPMIIFFLYAIIRVIISAMNYKKEKSDEEKQEAVDEAVAAALAEKDKENSGMNPENMTPEQLEQFKQFLAQQEAQKQEEAAKDPTDDSE